MPSLIRSLAVAALVGLLLVPSRGAGADTIYKLSLDTSAIAGQIFWVEFDLIDGDGVHNNFASISGLTGSTPITDAGSPVTTNDASGNLSSTVTLGDS